MHKRKTLLSWSSGKDSAWSLYILRQNPDVDVIGLFSVVNQQHQRVPMHATRLELLHQQARATGLELRTIELPVPCTAEQSSIIMGDFVEECIARNIECIAFGDLFLEDIRHYREQQMAGTGIDLLFPLWQIPTHELAKQMLAAGLQAYISSVDLSKLPASLLGRRWSEELLAELPDTIDPCGEYGEFHTIVVNGPMLDWPVDISFGEPTEQNGFAYADIIPRK